MIPEIFAEKSERLLRDHLPGLGLDQTPDEPDQVPVVRVPVRHPVNVRASRFLEQD